MRTRRCRHHGLTLVELLAATALSTLLLMALLSITAASRNAEAAMVRKDAQAVWADAAMAMLRWDTSHAQAITMQGNTLVMEGYLSLDASTLEPQHQWTKVTYSIVNVAQGIDQSDRPCLVRRQETTDPLRGTSIWTEIVMLDIASIQLIDFKPGQHVKLALTSTHAALGTRQWTVNLP